LSAVGEKLSRVLHYRRRKRQGRIRETKKTLLPLTAQVLEGKKVVFVRGFTPSRGGRRERKFGRV